MFEEDWENEVKETGKADIRKTEFLSVIEACKICIYA